MNAGMNEWASRDDDDTAALGRSIARSPIATVITDRRLPDNPIVVVNAAFCGLTGYSMEEVIGRNCRFLGGPRTDPGARKRLREAVARGQSALVELTNYRKDGTAFQNAVMVAPMKDASGGVRFYIGSQMDVTESAPLPSLRRREVPRLIESLTPRQRQVLEYLVAGYRNKQMAGFLGIDEKTVKMHRARLLQKLGVPTSADAIRIGVEAGL